MEYIAHIDEKDKKRIQTVKNHLEGTAKLSGEFAGKGSQGKVIRGWITLRQERGSAWRKVESTVF